MAMSNTDRVDKALKLLRGGLGPVCESTWQGFYGEGWLQQVNSKFRDPRSNGSTDDVAFLLTGIKVTWNEVFSHGFDPSVRSMVFAIAKIRNVWAHQQDFSDDDTWYALDSMERLLKEFKADKQRDQIRTIRRDLMRKMKLESINSNSVSKPKPSRLKCPLEETSEICGALPKQIERWIDEPTFLIPQSEIDQISYLRFDFLNLIEIKVIQELLSFGFLAEQLLDMPTTDTLGWQIDNFLFVDSNRCFRGDGVREPHREEPKEGLDRDLDPEIDPQNVPPPSKPPRVNSEIDPQNVHNYINLESDDWYIVINLYKIRKDLLANLAELRIPIPTYLDMDDTS